MVNLFKQTSISLSESDNNTEFYLPSKRKPKPAAHKTASHPTKSTKQSSQGASFRIQADIKQSIHESKQGPKIPKQNNIVTKQRELDSREAKQRWCKVKNENSSEKDRPNTYHVNRYVYWVTMVSTIECKVLLQVKQSTLSHYE